MNEDAAARTQTQQKTPQQIRFDKFVEQVEDELIILCDGTGRKFGRMVTHFEHTLSRRGIEASPEVRHVYRIRLHCGKPWSLVLVESDTDLRKFTGRCYGSDIFIPAIAPLPPEEESDSPELPYKLRKRLFNILKRGLQRLRQIRRRQHRNPTYQRFVNGSHRLFQTHVLHGHTFHNGNGLKT